MGASCWRPGLLALGIVFSTLVAPAASAHAQTISPAAPVATATPGPRVTELPGSFQQPDDVVVGGDGSVYVSDVGAGTVTRVGADGNATVLLDGLQAPEGMVFLPDGSLIVAEQGRNRLVRYDPVSHQVSVFLTLTNNTGQLGVDGVALDTHVVGQPTLIVPDSPNGTVLRVSLDGKKVSTIARGLVRPVAVWVEPDGSILVADEYGYRLQRLAPDGSRQTLARIGEPDDVVEDGAGHIYVNSLTDGAVYEIDAQTGARRVAVGGLLEPQGIALDGQGGLFVADPGHQRVIHVTAP